MRSFENKKAERVVRIFTYLVLSVIAFLIIYPIFWVTQTAFKTNMQIMQAPFSLPTSFSMNNFKEAWEMANFPRLFLNSIIATVSGVFVVLILTALAAYAFVRFNFKGKNILMLYFLLGLMIPPHMLMIPCFKLMSMLHLRNTLFSLVLTYSSWICFGIFFLRAYFLSIPQEIFDAACLDGCSEFRIFFRIIIPISAPGLTTVIIFYFAWIWNDFLFPLIYLQKESVRTVTLGLMNFAGKYTSYWSLQAASLSLALWPPLVFYLIFRKRIQKGLTEGAIKF
ncbi:carbohydrate ABC transporter permease [Candidatus Aerophobetes bacterium]|nr:carbohydrate ABC transporter permease [Candidatus Aerophobetes bacterium]